jgi:FkbM family methyltransferase
VNGIVLWLTTYMTDTSEQFVTGVETTLPLEYCNYHGELQFNVPVDKTLRDYFPASQKGIFLDIGAYDPIRISNSYHFERNGWTVHCFEANTNLVETLKQFRANVHNVAVADCEKEEVTFHVVCTEGGGRCHTAAISAIDLDPQYVKTFGNAIQTIEKLSVPQISLQSILPSLLGSTTHIDIVSIDVEGGELKVLKGLDLTKYSVKLFVIENLFGNPTYQSYLAGFGYILDKRIDYNEYYIKV